MTATSYCDVRTFARNCVYLALLIVVSVRSEVVEAVCNKTQCLGPLSYYKALGCKPVYKNPNDCCAEKYDCSFLKELSKDKCYVNGHEYNLGEKLRQEDGNPCDVECLCTKYEDEQAAMFLCAMVVCPYQALEPGCYFNRSVYHCCNNYEEICPGEDEQLPTCEVDGVIYKAGDSFEPKSDPDMTCYCMAGYTGENIEPFCKKPNKPYCAPLFHDADLVHRNCVPVYYDPEQSPQTDCSVMYRCQNKKDVVIHKHDSAKSVSDADNDMCRFGNMTMHMGDEVNQRNDYDSVCVKCVCEVPPVPTCKQLPSGECDVTNHAPFGNNF
ncbi:uncharacterized protein LOC122403233 [Colletes gigas]|uniref:uncharacterized protein LOC122403233 n=1 Tax=Colletes gigas TaxID=935657 RepID=UPI001C9ABF15|nr:uncharacterized protein LOC122403233 [Colletes gigas]